MNVTGQLFESNLKKYWKLDAVSDTPLDVTKINVLLCYLSMCQYCNVHAVLHVNVYANTTVNKIYSNIKGLWENKRHYTGTLT